MDDNNKAMEMFLKARFSTLNNIIMLLLVWEIGGDRKTKISILQLFKKIIKAEKKQKEINK